MQCWLVARPLRLRAHPRRRLPAIATDQPFCVCAAEVPSAWPPGRTWRRRRSCGRRRLYHRRRPLLVGPDHDGAAVDRHERRTRRPAASGRQLGQLDKAPPSSMRKRMSPVRDGVVANRRLPDHDGVAVGATELGRRRTSPAAASDPSAWPPGRTWPRQPSIVRP